MATKFFGNIFLCWRPKVGERRIKVGVLHQSSNGLTFRYTDEAKKAAEQSGFTPYAGFPNLNETYTKNVLEIFSQRLTRSERPDIDKYYAFWRIAPEYRNDKLYLLAKTQGLLASDMFEFLADYNPVRGLDFVSDISGLSHTKLPADALSSGDILEWKREPENEQDKYAIALYKDKQKIGYVKKIHNLVFHKATHPIRVEVISTEANGHLNRAYIRIYL